MQKDNEKNHRVRLAIGNGVRTDIWSEFLNRFGEIKVRELYAATEGNIGFINYTSKVGAVGRVNVVHRVRNRSSVFSHDSSTSLRDGKISLSVQHFGPDLNIYI